MAQTQTVVLKLAGVVACSAVVALILRGCNPEQPTTEYEKLYDQYYKEQQDQSNKAVGFRRSVVPGKVARLIAGPPLLVPLDKEAYEEVEKLAQANDDLGVRGMVASGRAILVPGGTQIKVIEVNGILDLMCRVRILEGSYTGQDGWIPIKFLQQE
jgi:hypothetical protein